MGAFLTRRLFITKDDPVTLSVGGVSELLAVQSSFTDQGGELLAVQSSFTDQGGVPVSDLRVYHQDESVSQPLDSFQIDRSAFTQLNNQVDGTGSARDLGSRHAISQISDTKPH